MKSIFTRISLASLARLLWTLVLLTLPVTSFRFMPFMGAGTYVRPLALYPLVLLLPVLLLRLWRREIPHPWPGALTVLLAFGLAALAATALGATLAPLELRGVDFTNRAVRAILTLAIGSSFFLAAIWMNQDEAQVRFSVRCLLAGLAAQLLWGAIQFVGLNTGHRPQLQRIQTLFSLRGLVKNKRISGFAYEPSWLAGQIAVLYIPWLAAAVLARYRAMKVGWLPVWLSGLLEPLLLLLALAGILMTYSRSGLVVVALAGLVTFIIAGRDWLSVAWDWVKDGFRRNPGRGLALGAAARRVLLGLLILAVLGGAVSFLADKGYIATFFKSDKTDIFSYAVDVYLGPRLAYASAALTAFDAHPLTGVGLGASGFAIYPNMPDWVLAGVPEISNALSPDSSLYPNPKNLYVRLLAETGILGLALFLLFYLALFADCLSLLRTSGVGKWLAAAGIFALAAITLQGVSQDSFAMPEMWINLGILAGSASAFKNQKTDQKQKAFPAEARDEDKP